MWQHHNSALHETESRRILIVEGYVNKQVIQVYAAGAQALLAADLLTSNAYLRNSSI